MELVNLTTTQCLNEASEQMKAKSEQRSSSNEDDRALEALNNIQPLHVLLQPLIDEVCSGLTKMGKIVGGATPPKDAGPETVAIFIETQRSCELNVIMPIEEMSRILKARRELLREMHEHQGAELERLTKLLDEWSQKHDSNLKRVSELESHASVLAERSSAILTATRDLRPQITDAEAAYFKDLKRYETNCNKWEGNVNQLRKDASTVCDTMTATAIASGDVRCIVDLSPEKVDICHKLLRGEGQLLRQLERKVKESNEVVEKLSKTISGLQPIGGDKENYLLYSARGRGD